MAEEKPKRPTTKPIPAEVQFATGETASPDAGWEVVAEHYVGYGEKLFILGRKG